MVTLTGGPIMVSTNDDRVRGMAAAEVENQKTAQTEEEEDTSCSKILAPHRATMGFFR
jgi:hypothetical protein